MNAITRLCFTKQGLINPNAVAHISKSRNDEIVLFTDGSQEAYDHLKAYDLNDLRRHTSNIGLARTPIAAMRVRSVDGTLSKPNYVYSDKHRMYWVASMVTSPHLTISISDLSKKNETEVKLDTREKDQLCFLSYLLWSSMLVAEERLCFPAAVIDRLARLTYYLTPSTFDLSLLRRETGLETLNYNPNNDVLSVEVAGDIFTVSMDVLNKFYGDYILPIFTKLLGRRTRLVVIVTGGDDARSEPTEMSYGQLGAIVEDFSKHVDQTLISCDHPLDAADLLEHAKKVRINEESCLWPRTHQTITDFIDASYADLVPQHPAHDSASADDTASVFADAEPEPAERT